MTNRRAGQTGQIDFQGRSHDGSDCGSYKLIERVGPSRWVVEWTAACDRESDEVGSRLNRSTLQFVSRQRYDRYF